MSVISAKDAAKKWGISQRRVAALCSEGRIPNAQRVGNMWVIPSAAEKPIDGRHLRYTIEDLLPIKPFLKWAGGKGQLLSQIQELYPFEDMKIKRYAEPFIGGGAVLFDILSKYELDEVYISDINAKFIPIEIEERKEYFYKQRDRFNELKGMENNNVDFEKAALMIFLNKTCFNGLYRVNKKGLFNVPMGGYKKPTICDEKNLRAVSERLQNVNIVHGDYKQSESFIDSNTFVYFDPPYRPITESASFTAYTEYDFNDKEQIELAEFVNKINDKGAKIVVSNSDPKNTDENDDFFDEIYSSHSIKRVDASRMINSNGAKRGKIKELLISNF